MKKLLSLFDTNILFYCVVLLLVFIPVYPKLPAIDIKHTWVSIRIEDFLIAFTSVVFLIQLARKKAGVYLPLGIPIIVYWIIGLISLIISFIFIAPHLANFFPSVAILSYLRRIEYMILFFIGFAAIRQENMLKKLFWVLLAACIIILLYGVGQRHYIQVWAMFPDFFRNFSFCFPSFQTTNEEFAKGIPLCLPADGRVTSLFGGHYDLSAYLVLVIPILYAMVFVFKKLWQKVLIASVAVGLVYLLMLTASRVSLAAYIIAAVLALTFVKKKWFIIPVLIVTMYFLVTSSSGVLQRLSQTLRFTNLVMNSDGEVIGEALNKLPEDLKNKISKNNIYDAPPPTQELPTGTSYISLPGSGTSTSSALVKSNPNLSAAQRERYKFGAIEISPVTGNFLVQRALVYDISFTTRFQGEWPVSFGAFQKNPLTGSGYSTITLSSDNSFIRALGEVGLLGFISYFSFFLIWFIFVKKMQKDATPINRNFVLGLSAGVIGLSLNALMIDVFEASKVAESMWLLLGIGGGALLISKHEKINYFLEIKKILSSSFFLMTYVLILFFVFLGRSFDNYFVADDFSWVRAAATSDAQKLIMSFVNAQGSILSPVAKLFIFLEYTLFSLKPLPYHVFNLFFNFSAGVAAYFLLFAVFKKKRTAFLGAILFSFIPSHSQNLLWISTLSSTLSSAFILLGLLSFYYARTKKSIALYALSMILFFTSVFTYENAVIFIGLMLLIDVFLIGKKLRRSVASRFAPYVISLGIIGGYLLIRSQSHAASFSGDYIYDLAKVIPKIVSNYLGYIMMFLSGENSLAVYSQIRTVLETHSILVSVIGFLIVAAVAGFLIERREKFHLSQSMRLFIFGFLFSVISLLPYLSLENITLRYGYLASFGFILMILILIEGILSRIFKKRQINLYAYACVTLIIGVICFMGLQAAESHWEKASKISYFTLAKFKLDIPILKKTDIYFYNVPAKTGEAHIFPVGLPDAMYFVDNDPSIKSFVMKDLTQAKLLKKSSLEKKRNALIFTFGKNFELKQIK